MKILQVSCGGLGNGGVQSVIMTICRNLSPDSCDIILFTKEKRFYDDEFLSLGGKIFRIPKFEGDSKIFRKIDLVLSLFRIFFGTIKIIRKNKTYDVIHCHSQLESGICNLAAKICHVKIRITHTHTSSKFVPREGIIKYFYQSMLLKLTKVTTNYFLSCSEEALVNNYGKNILKCIHKVVYNPIDFNRFNIGAVKIERAHDTIVHVGRFDDNKNQVFLLPILKLVKTKIPDVHLILIGFGDVYERKIMDNIIKYELEDNVEILPSNSDIPSILAKADLMIFPSKSEGFGIALVEAQAMQVPCLVSDTVPRSVDCGLCKFLSLEQSPEMWSKEALRILDQEQEMILDFERLGRFKTSEFMNSIKNAYQGV